MGRRVQKSGQGEKGFRQPDRAATSVGKSADRGHAESSQGPDNRQPAREEGPRGEVLGGDQEGYTRDGKYGVLNPLNAKGVLKARQRKDIQSEDLVEAVLWDSIDAEHVCLLGRRDKEGGNGPARGDSNANGADVSALR